MALSVVIASRIEAARKAAGITQEQLSALTHIPQSTLSRKLTPKHPGRNKFDLDELDAIASVLKRDASDIVREAEAVS